jgi:hypothetical protein
MDDGIEKLVPRDRPEECDPKTCDHACDNPTESCYAYRIEWCRTMLRDFEDGFLVVQNKLSNLVKSDSNALVKVEGLLLSVNNMLHMVKLSSMILRGDYKEAEQASDEDDYERKLRFNIGLGNEDDGDMED